LQGKKIEASGITPFSHLCRDGGPQLIRTWRDVTRMTTSVSRRETAVRDLRCNCDTSSTLPRSGKAPKVTSLVSDHLLRARWCGTKLFLQFLEPLSHRLDRLEEATVDALAIRIDLILVLHRFEIVDNDGDEQVDDDEDGQ
jgi:hypothetical protein